MSDRRSRPGGLRSVRRDGGDVRGEAARDDGDVSGAAGGRGGRALLLRAAEVGVEERCHAD